VGERNEGKENVDEDKEEKEGNNVVGRRRMRKGSRRKREGNSGEA
jgi:hypothetical protein